MAKRTVDILLRARDATAQGFRSAEKGLNRLAGSVLNLRNIMIGGVGFYAVARFLSNATQEAQKFQTELAMVNTMLDGRTGPAMAQFEVGLQSMALEFGESTDTLSKGLYDILSAGIAADKALNLLRVGASGAIGGITDTSTSVSALLTVLKSYNIDAKDAAKVSDLLFQTVKKGRLTFQQLAQGIGSVSATASLSGLSLNELLATISSITRAGVPVEQAFTAIENIVKAFTTSTDEAKKVAREFGLELSVETLKTKGLFGALEKLQGISPEKITKIFPSIRGFRGIAPLIADINGMRADLDGLADSTGQAGEAFRKMAETRAFEKLRESNKALSREVGSLLLPAVKAVSEHLREMVAEMQYMIRGMGVELAQSVRLTGNLTAASKELQEQTRQTLRELIELRGKASLSPEDEQRIAAITTDLKGQGIAVAKIWDDAEGSVDNFRDALEQALGAREQRAGFKNIEKDIQGVRSELHRLVEEQIKLELASDRGPIAQIGATGPGMGNRAKRLKELAPLIDILRKKNEELILTELTLQELEEPSLLPLPKIQAAADLAAAAAIEKARKKAEEEAKKSAQRIFEQTRTDAEIFVRRMGELTSLQKIGAIDPETFKRAVALAEEARDKIADAAREIAVESGRAVFEATRTPIERFEAEIKKLRGFLEEGVITTDVFDRAVAAAKEIRDAAEDVSDMSIEIGGRRGAGAALESRFLTRQPGANVPAEQTAKNTGALVKQGEKQSDMLADMVQALGPDLASKLGLSINVLRF